MLSELKQITPHHAHYDRGGPSWLWSYGCWMYKKIVQLPMQSAHHHWCYGFDFRPGRGVQHYL